MAITDGVKAKLNKMNRAAQDATLGTAIQDLQTAVAGIVKGSYTAIAADQTAGYKVINTGITITGWVVQVYRASILLASYKVTATTTNLKIETNSTDYVMGTNDVIKYIVF